MDGMSVSSQQLYERLGLASVPMLVDVRHEDALGADEAMIIGAVRPPETIARWQHALPKGRGVVVHCVHGYEVSQGVAGALKTAGTKAAYLEGGIADWKAQDLPTRRMRDASEKQTGHPRTSKDRPDRLSMADQALRQSRGGLHLRSPTDVAKVAADVGGTPYDIKGVEFGSNRSPTSFTSPWASPA
jgi:rhodanese-related sulfurtransferase